MTALLCFLKAGTTNSVGRYGCLSVAKWEMPLSGTLCLFAGGARATNSLPADPPFIVDNQDAQSRKSV